MKTKVTLLAFFATITFYAQSQSNPRDLLPTNSPKTTNSGTPPKVDVPRIVDAPKVDVPRLNDADDDLLDVKTKVKTDDLLPLKSEKTGSSSTSRTDTTKDGVNSTLTIKNKGNQTTQPQRDKESIGVIKEKNNGTLINPSREKDDAPKDGFTKVKGNGTLTQPNTVNDNTTGGIKPIRTSSNPNGGDVKATVGTVVNENNPLQNNESTSTPRPKSPKDALGNKPKAEDVNTNVKPTAEQLQDKMQGKDLIKTIDKTPTNDKPKVETRTQNLPVSETKVKDEKVKKN